MGRGSTGPHRRRARRTLRTAAACALAFAALGAGAGAAHASSPVFALGDQHPETFSDPEFRAIGVNRTRAVIPWNDVFNATGRARWDAWFSAVRRARLEPMVAFAAAEGSNCPHSPCVLPSTRTYQSALRSFIRRYPYVKIYQPWDEPNSVTEPTGNSRGPRQLAAYYDSLKLACRTCTVLGGDVQDIGNFTGYVRSFARYIRQRPPTIWGFHNYTDVNRGSSRNTAAFLRAVKGDVWLTETGGLYSFTESNGDVAFPPSSSRQERATDNMFTIARRYESRIRRVYIYQWRADSFDRFDAGLESPTGQLRGAYTIVRRNRALFR